SAGVAPDRELDGHRVRHPTPSHARRDREDGDPADAPAHELEQAGGGADSRSVPSDALQQDEEARNPGRRQIRRPEIRERLTCRPQAHPRQGPLVRGTTLEGTALDRAWTSGRARWQQGRGDVEERSRVLLATLIGAVAGGAWGWLYLTEGGRRVRSQI